MRHSYATHLYAKTLDLRLVQKQLGHSSPAITQIYADIVHSNLNKAFSSPLFD
jgi:integrase/recombinase XerC